MNNKVLVELYVVKLEARYDVFVPCNKKLKNVISLMIKAIFELTNGEFPKQDQVMLVDKMTGQIYDNEKTLKELGVLNGSKLLLV